MQNIGFGRTYRCLRRMWKYQHQLQLLPKPSLPKNVKDGTEKIGYKHGKPNCFPVPFYYSFHVVFTLPEVLNKTALHEPKMLYDILFESAWETLQTFGKKQKSPNGNDCCFAHLGTEFESSSAFALHCSRWWRG